MAPSLLAKEGPLEGRRFTLDSELVLGRVGADVTIEDPLISRRHAVIRSAGGRIQIEDLGSSNGTWVNGERITTPKRLEPGDLIKVGETTFEVEADPADKGRTVLAGPLDLPGARSVSAAPPAPRPPVAPPPQQPPSAPPSAPPRPPPAPEQAPPGRAENEPRLVTAVVANIGGSPSLRERLASGRVEALFGECLGRMTRAVERYGGTVQQHGADGFAALFGLPAAHEDDPERAARAALAIVGVVKEYEREVEAAWGATELSVRIGIETGETGVAPADRADLEAVARGETAGAATRLQSLAEPGTIAVGRATARCLVHEFVLEPLGDIAEGRGEQVETWKLIAAQAADQAPSGTPMVGSDAELARLGAPSPGQGAERVQAPPEPATRPAPPGLPAIPRLSLRLDVDWEAGEVLLGLGEESEQVRLAYEGGRWRIAPSG